MVEEALQNVHDLLATEPADRAAFEELRGEYEKRGLAQTFIQSLHDLEKRLEETAQWPGLVFILECHQQALLDPQERSSILVRLGEIYHQKLENKYLAIENYVKALELDYQKTFLLDRLGEIYAEKHEDFHDVIEHHEHAAANEQVQEKRHVHWLEIADVFSKVLAKPEKALTYYERILTDNPLHQTALDAAEQTYIQTSDWKGLVGFFEKRIRQFNEVEPQGSASPAISLLYKMANIYKNKLNKPFEAMETYERILQLAPNNLQVRSFIDQLRMQNALWEKAAADFLQEAKDTQEPLEKLAHYENAAKIFFNILNQKTEGINLYRSILTIHPENQRARDILRETFFKNNKISDYIEILESLCKQSSELGFRIARLKEIGAIYRDHLSLIPLAIHAFTRARRENSQDREIMEALEGLYWEQKDWQALPDVLENLLALTITPEERIPLLHKLARIEGKQLGEVSKAIRLYREILSLDQNHMESLYALEDIYQAERDWEGLRFVYSNLLPIVQDSAKQLDTLKKFAHLLVHRFGESERAIALFKRAQHLNPHDLKITLELEKIFLDQKEWKKLTELYESEAAKARSAEMVSLWLRKSAEIHERHLQNPSRAIEAYRNALESDPQNRKIMRALETLFEKSKNWENLVELCKCELALEPEYQAQSIPLLLRLAEVLEHRLTKFSEAIPYYEAVSALDSENHSAIKALERLYLRQEDWTNLLSIYKRQLHTLSQNDQNQEALLHLYRRISSLYLDKLHQPNEAVLINEKILEISSADMAAIQNLKTLYLERKKWIELVNTLQREAKHAPEQSRRVKLLKEISTIFQEKLHDERHAMETLHQAYSIAPEDDEILLALTRHYERIQDWEKLSALYEQALLGQQNPEAQITVLEKIASIQIKQKAFELACATYQKIIALAPRHREAIRSLQFLYRELENWEAMKDLLLQVTKHEENSLDKANLHFQIGQIYESNLQDHGLSLDYYRLTLQDDPHHLQAIHAIRSILKQARNWGEYLRYSQSALSFMDNKDDMMQLLEEMGEIWRDEFHHNHQAIKCYYEAHLLKPHHMLALRALFTLYNEEEQWQAAVDIGQKLLHLTQNPEEQIDIRLQIARIYLTNLQDMNRAASLYQEAFALDPKNTGLLGELKDLQRKREQWQSVVNLSHQQIDMTVKPEEKLYLLQDIADIWENKLKSHANAQKARHEILKIIPFHIHTLNDICSSALERSFWEEIEQEVLSRLDLDYPLEDKVQSLLILAKGWNESFHHPTAAIRCLKIAQDLAPNHREVMEWLLNFLYQTAQWNEFIEVAKSEIQILQGFTHDPSVKEKISARLCQCAEVSLFHLNSSLDAIAFYNEARHHDPTSIAILKLLEPLIIEQKNWSSLLEIYDTWVELTPHDLEKIEAELKMAEISLQHLHDREQAEHHYQNILARDDRNLKALEGLFTVTKQRQDWLEAIEYAERMLPLMGPIPQAIALNLEMAGLYQDHLNQAPGVENCALRALEIDSRNLQALHLLQDFYKREGKWDRLLHMNQREATLYLTEAREIYLYTEMAEIWEKHFQDTTKTAHCYKRLEALAVHDDSLWPGITDFYRRTRRWGDLASSLQQQVESLLDDAIRLAQSHFELGLLFLNHLDEPERGVEHLETSLRINPHDPSVLEQAIKIYRDLDRSEELLSSLEKKAAMEDSVPTLLEIAQLWKTRFGVLPNAEEAFLRILKIDRQNEESLENLRTMYKAGGRYDAYAQILQEILLTTSDPDLSLPLHLELASILNHHLGDHEPAIRHYEQVLALSPQHAESIEALLDLYPRHSLWDAYLQLLDKLVQGTDDPQKQCGFLLKQADIYLHQLQQSEKSVLYFEQALNRAERKDQDPILEQLRTLYLDFGQWTKLLKIYERLFDRATTDTMKVDTLVQRAQIEETKLQDRAAAATTYRRILSILPTHRSSILKMLTLLDEKIDRKEMIDLYKKRVALEPDPMNQSTSLYCLAQLYSDHSKQRISYLNKTLELNPSHQQAITQLRQHYLKEENWPQAIEYLQREIHIGFAEQDLTNAHLELGKIYFHHLPDEQKARDHFQAVLNTDSQNTYATAALADIFYRCEDGVAAKPYLQQLSLKSGIKSSTTKPDDALIQFKLSDDEIAYRLGHIALQSNHLDEARIHLQQAIQSNPKHFEAQRMLGELYFSTKQWKNAVPVYEQLLRLLDQMPSMVSLPAATCHFRLGCIYFEIARSQVPPDQEAIQLAKQNLLTVLETEQNHTQALLAVSEVLVMIEDWDEAIEYMERLQQSSRDELVILDCFCRQGDLYNQKLQKPALAIRCYKQALERDAECVHALQALAELYQIRRDWPEALEMLSRLGNVLADPDSRSENFYTQAKIYGREIGDAEKALALLEKSLESTPDHRKSLDEITLLYQKREHWDQLLQHYRYCLKVLPKQEHETLYRMQLEMGEILVDKLKAYDEAEIIFQDILREIPQHQKAKLSLARIHSQKEITFTRALNEYAELLRDDPGFLEGYQEFHALACKMNLRKHAATISSIIEFIENPDQPLVPNLLSPAQMPAALLTQEDWIHPEEAGFLRDIFQRLKEDLSKVLSLEIPTQSVSISGHTENNLDRVLKTITELGIQLRADRHTLGLRLLYPFPPNLLFINEVYESRCTPGTWQFLAGRSVYYLNHGFFALLHYPQVSQLRRFLLAFGRHFNEYMDSQFVPDEEFSRLHKCFKKALSRTHRKDLQEAASKLVENWDRIDFKAWMQAVKHSANRMGLLLGQDLKAALVTLAMYPDALDQPEKSFRDFAQTSVEERCNWLRQNAESRELVRFAVSEEYLSRLV